MNSESLNSPLLDMLCLITQKFGKGFGDILFRLHKLIPSSNMLKIEFEIGRLLNVEQNECVRTLLVFLCLTLTFTVPTTVYFIAISTHALFLILINLALICWGIWAVNGYRNGVIPSPIVFIVALSQAIVQVLGEALLHHCFRHHQTIIQRKLDEEFTNLNNTEQTLTFLKQKMPSDIVGIIKGYACDPHMEKLYASKIAVESINKSLGECETAPKILEYVSDDFLPPVFEINYPCQSGGKLRGTFKCGYEVKLNVNFGEHSVTPSNKQHYFSYNPQKDTLNVLERGVSRTVQKQYVELHF